MIETEKFTSVLFSASSKGAWTFATIPAEYTPSQTYGWGRTPVVATVDGQTWETSLWKDTKSGKTLLAIPKKIRKGKGDGDTVEVSFRLREPE